MGQIAGWDNAPVEKIFVEYFPKKVTLIYPYYCNLKFLSRQMAHWDMFPDDLKRHLSVIIVDDGSPKDQMAENSIKAYPQKLPISIRLFYIDVDIRFNWIAARNIAMSAADGWCLGTDMDHMVPQETAESLVWGSHNPNYIYRLSRREHTGEKIHSHPNTWFMTKKMFWKFGGYDENFSGYYGTDGEARRRWVKTAPVKTLREDVMRYEYVDDSSTERYQRKLPYDYSSITKILKARTKDWKPKVLSFPYHEVTL